MALVQALHYGFLIFLFFLNELTADTYLEFTYSKYYSKDTVDNGR